jgi:trans-AT polyketide synthase, acyltransferase and oxidoreductase domains
VHLAPSEPNAAAAKPVVAIVPPCTPEHLGDRHFVEDHGLQYPYVAGAMANGIASAELVEAMGRGGMLGMFGAAGLAPKVVAKAIDRIATRLGNRPWGANLIHSPYEPELEDAIVDLYLQRQVHLVSASAYLDMTLPVVRYRVAGIHTDAEGRVLTRNRIMAKVSRIEVARKFFAPPPDAMLGELVRRGDITAAQANMARTIPVAQDLTVEADSGGHTDNRPALALLPTMLALRDRMQARHDYATKLRVGAAGGISTPHSAAAAFAMGAAFIVTGSINQATREAGTSDLVRRLLAEVEQADVRMAPAADMFEMGVKLQVTNRKTMFPMRAQRLHDLYTTYPSLEAIPEPQRRDIEKSIFRTGLDQVWRETQSFWSDRDPDQLTRAAADPHHQMALVFRWYLGQSSRWANAGVADRQLDFQVWCGPSMGAFNEWTRGSWLESWENRRAVPIARNILRGAAILTRAHSLRGQGIDLPSDCIDVAPREVAELEEIPT